MSIIIKPVITEKASDKSEVLNQYSFFVNTKANKIQIKKAIEDQFGVSVIDVRTMIYAPKVKTRYTRSGFQSGKTNKLKKAIVKVEEGQTIDLYI